MNTKDLANLRSSLHVSQTKLAARLDTHQSALSRIESGIVDPSFTFVNRYLKELGYHLEAVKDE